MSSSPTMLLASVLALGAALPASAEPLAGTDPVATQQGTITSLDEASGRVVVKPSEGEELRVVVPPSVAARFNPGDSVDVATQLTLRAGGDLSGSGAEAGDTTGSGASGSGAPGSMKPPSEFDNEPGKVE